MVKKGLAQAPDPRRLGEPELGVRDCRGVCAFAGRRSPPSLKPSRRRDRKRSNTTRAAARPGSTAAASGHHGAAAGPPRSRGRMRISPPRKCLSASDRAIPGSAGVSAAARHFCREWAQWRKRGVRIPQPAKALGAQQVEKLLAARAQWPDAQVLPPGNFAGATAKQVPTRRCCANRYGFYRGPTADVEPLRPAGRLPRGKRSGSRPERASSGRGLMVRCCGRVRGAAGRGVARPGAALLLGCGLWSDQVWRPWRAPRKRSGWQGGQKIRPRRTMAAHGIGNQRANRERMSVPAATGKKTERRRCLRAPRG